MRLLFIVLAISSCYGLCAQPKDSLISSYYTVPYKQTPVYQKPASLTFKSLFIPGALVAYGFTSQENGHLKEFDTDIRNEIREDHPYFHTTIDNYLQYAPGIAVFGLNAIGIKGRSNFRDRTLIFFLSNSIMGITVQSLKRITKVQRPDGSGQNAFPSGHTATAFTGAEFLHQEYKNVSPWYGIAGYAVATTTGILRMYNNRHWFRDVMAGAGFGMLSTKLAYYIEPIIARKLFHKKKQLFSFAE